MFDKLDITFAPGIKDTREDLEASPIFQQWVERFNTLSLALHGVHIYAVHRWVEDGDIKMIHLVANATDPSGMRLGGVTTLRENTADVLVIVDVVHDGVRVSGPYVLFVAQPRAPWPQDLILSNPSGGVEEPHENFLKAGLREVYEELGWDEDTALPEPTDMTDSVLGNAEALPVSPGGSNERVKLLKIRFEITPEQLKLLLDKFGGSSAEGEVTKIIFRPLEDAIASLTMFGAADLKTFCSLLLEFYIRHSESRNSALPRGSVTDYAGKPPALPQQ